MIARRQQYLLVRKVYMIPEEKIERVWQLLSEAMKERPLSDRLAHLSWLLLLKYIDGYEATFKSKSKQGGKLYVPILESTYCWSTWVPKALSTSCVDGKKLIEFLRDDLFIYLASLRTIPHKLEIHDTLCSIFEWKEIPICDVTHLLIEMLYIINDINFYDMDHRSAIASLYEDYVQDMEVVATSARDFFTPREVVCAMLEVLRPQQNQAFLDPTCGTGAFLIEIYKYMEFHYSQQASEPMPLFGRALDNTSALISVINMASIGKPIERIYCGDMLQGYPDYFPRKFGYILANPPFGRFEDEKIINGHSFLRTRNNEPLFLQHCISNLALGGSGAIIVSDTALTKETRDFVTMRQSLLQQCKLRMVVYLPYNTFKVKVYTTILFFTKFREIPEISSFAKEPYATNEILYFAPAKETHSLELYLKAVYRAWENYLDGKTVPTDSAIAHWIEHFDVTIFRQKGFCLKKRFTSIQYELPQPSLDLIEQIVDKKELFVMLADDNQFPLASSTMLLKKCQELHNSLERVYNELTS